MTDDVRTDKGLDSGFAALLEKITRDRGFRCASYKQRCLKRRVAVRMRARGVLQYDDYAQLLDRDASEYEKLIETLTINVTKLFRNWDVYAAIAEHVVPALWGGEAEAPDAGRSACGAPDVPPARSPIRSRCSFIATRR